MDNNHTFEAKLGAPKPASHYLKFWFKNQELSAPHAAKVLGVSKSTVTRLLNGEGKLSIEIANKLFVKYNIDPYLLFSLDAQYKSHIAKSIV
ncbi:helix-turn-helix transcriptional regulator [Psychrosphaera aquimarina]|uniref:Helix-turn-helix transcriptional regulator n=1 Tax=Psychrosphaera aquimarina TaxID=2044854 RepID=A0ABU3QY00_9GAMM|nr:helix-turn-helix transcriptional regulator [Psychrosphaera aquimarina]MDU0112282.1 helix-turn-helix transcriptional regulator [Psychrosphaera aquimarina]